MKKMMFIAAIALCAMSCGNKAANAEEAAEEAAVVEEVVVEEAPVAEEEATLVDTINAVVDGAAAVAENIMDKVAE